MSPLAGKDQGAFFLKHYALKDPISPLPFRPAPALPFLDGALLIWPTGRIRALCYIQRSHSSWVRWPIRSAQSGTTRLSWSSLSFRRKSHRQLPTNSASELYSSMPIAARSYRQDSHWNIHKTTRETQAPRTQSSVVLSRSPTSTTSQRNASTSGQHGAVHNDGAMQRETEWQHDLRDQDIETQKRYKECLRGNQRARNVYRGQRRTGETGGKRHQRCVSC